MNRNIVPRSNLSVRLPDNAPMPRGATQPGDAAWADLADIIKSLGISPAQFLGIVKDLPLQELDKWTSTARSAHTFEVEKSGDWRRGWILVESDGEDAV